MYTNKHTGLHSYLSLDIAMTSIWHVQPNPSSTHNHYQFISNFNPASVHTLALTPTIHPSILYTRSNSGLRGSWSISQLSLTKRHPGRVASPSQLTLTKTAKCTFCLIRTGLQSPEELLAPSRSIIILEKARQVYL